MTAGTAASGIGVVTGAIAITAGTIEPTTVGTMAGITAVTIGDITGITVTVGTTAATS